ncbi:MAG: GNAT family N-acetyltransferase [Raoultibacter sp.]
MTSTMDGRSGHVVRGIICALIGGVFWGFSGSCAQILMQSYGVPALWITCVRLLIAALFFLVIVVVKDWRTLFAVFRDRRSFLTIVVFSIFGVVLVQISYLYSIEYVGAGTATVIEQLALIIILFFVCIKTRRLPRVREILGLVTALAGMFVIATQGDPKTIAMPIEGLFWGLISAGAVACYTLIPGRVLEKWGSMIVTGLSMLFGGVIASVFVQPWTMPVTLEPGAVLALGAIVLVGTLAAYMLYLQGVADAGPVRASLLCCVEPISAMVIAFFWLGTPVSFYDIIGCALILVMVFLVTQNEKQSDDAVASSVKDDDPPLFLGRASVLGYFGSRVATGDDIGAIEKLLDEGHEAIESLAIKEGRKKYPSSRRLMHSIKNHTTYVIEDTDNEMIGVFAVSRADDKNYAKVVEGQWLTASSQQAPTYAELHWVAVSASSRRRGVGMFILDTADHIARKAGRRSIRADIYEKNEPMRILLKKHGYTECGVIAFRDYFGREKRRAIFEKILPFQ